MKRHWEIDELIAHFSLRPEETALLAGSEAANQLGLAVLLKFFQYEGRFPINKKEVPEAVLAFLARQLAVDSAVFEAYRWAGRTIKTHRRTIRHLYEFRRASKHDQRKIQTWLYEKVVADEQNFEKLKEVTYERFREIRRTPPTQDQLERLINGAISTYERRFYQTTYDQLSEELRHQLAALLVSAEPLPTGEDTLEKIPFHELKNDPGEPNVIHIKQTAARLEQLQQLRLPPRLLGST